MDPFQSCFLGKVNIPQPLSHAAGKRVLNPICPCRPCPGWPIWGSPICQYLAHAPLDLSMYLSKCLLNVIVPASLEVCDVEVVPWKIVVVTLVYTHSRLIIQLFLFWSENVPLFAKVLSPEVIFGTFLFSNFLIALSSSEETRFLPSAQFGGRQ